MSAAPPTTTVLPPSRSSIRSRVFGLARLLIALAILIWVARKLPWKDQLEFRTESGAALDLVGHIEGDWKGDLVRFFPEDPAAVDERWPLGAREPVARGEPILARRRGGKEATGFEWQPGMPRAFREMDVPRLVLAQVLLFLASLTIVTRWWRLLHLAGCPTSWWNALRLTFLGLFFNNVMPGATGGDLVKGVMVAKENRGRGAEALMTVLVDRIFGMVALAVLALLVILLAPGAFDDLRLGLFVGLGLVALGTALYASKRVRRVLGLSRLVSRLPVADKLRALDRAAMLYLKQPRGLVVAFLFSLVNHVLVTLAVWVLGLALGVSASQVTLENYFVLVPVANLVGALPVAPGGWGVGELAFRSLFLMIGASAAMGVAVSVSFRLSQLGIGLLGGLFLLFPGSRSELRDARKD